jgi:hypothetical protein
MGFLHFKPLCVVALPLNSEVNSSTVDGKTTRLQIYRLLWPAWLGCRCAWYYCKIHTTHYSTGLCV